MVRNIISFCSLLLLAIHFAAAQSTLCNGADPFCTGTTAIFPAGVNEGSAQVGANYGCLYTRPNPAWYYMQVDTAGTIEIEMHSTPAHDIDFACWGPFVSPTTPCVAQLTAGPNTPTHAVAGPSSYYPTLNMIDCSYSIYSTEYCYIPNGQAGQFYILLITNYSNQQCDITFSQTSGTGTTSCTILPYISGDSVCVGQTIHLAVLIPTPGATYAWSGPNNFHSNLQNPIIPNANPGMTGTYSMVMTVGGVASPPISCDVFVGQYPSIAITPVNPAACLGTPFFLTGHSSEPNTTYVWSDGSHTNPTPINPSSASTYWVTGTTQWGCTGTSSVYVDVLSPPSVSASANPTSVCGGNPVTLFAMGAVSYQWSHGLGTNNPVFPIPVGSTTYTVTGTAANGCTASAPVAVTTYGPPVNISASPDSICDGGSTVLTASFGLTYTWSHGLGTNPTVTVYPTTTTIYSVTATDGGGCTASTFRTIAVHPSVAVGVTITASPPDSICSGTVVTFHANVVNGGTTPFYAWKRNNNPAGTNAANYVAPVLFNNDVIKCIVTSNAYCAAPNPATSNLITIHVAAALHASVSITASPPGPICTGTHVTFTAIPVSGGNPTYQWKNNGVPISGETGPTYSTSSLPPGNNSITVAMTSTLTPCVTGSPATSPPVVISVSPVPVPTINSAGPFCETHGAMNLTAVNPGGIWSGPGITNAVSGTFSPGTAGPGIHTISYILSNGVCQDTGHTNITVHMLANASIVPMGPFCISSPAFTLISVSAGGTWHGQGVIDTALGIFDPAVAGPGSHLISYRINDVCSDTGYATLIITDTANAGINTAGPFCTNTAPVILTAGTAGGVWSGTGITSDSLGIFNPAVAGPGIHAITYMITGGLCADTGYANITVLPAPSGTINTAGPFCTANAPVNLTAATPGGIWSGNGITNPGMGTFNPFTAGPGTHLITYVVNSGGCDGSDTTNIVVHSTPNADINPAGPYCTNQSPFTLNPVNTGGTWSGAGITNPVLGTFDPSTAGPGMHTINYLINTGFCADTGHVNIMVNNIADAGIHPAGPYCSTDAADTLTAVNPGGVWSGPGIINPALGTFDPASGIGTHLIRYIISSGSCSDTGFVSILVKNIFNATITQAGPFCLGHGPVTLTAVDPGGIWSGQGITDSVHGIFDPDSAGSGAQVITYTISIGQCSASDQISIVVNDTVDAQIFPAGPFCETSSSINMTAVSTGGTWSGTGITSGTLGTFDPAVAGPGTHLVIYIINGDCPDTGYMNVVVDSLPDANIHPAGPYCIDATPVNLSAGTPGGVWSGTGITNPVTGTFNPAIAGAGSHLITYSFVGPCFVSGSATIVVDLCTGIERDKSSGGISIYPNPGNGQFTIEIPSGNVYRLNIYNMLGTLVYETYIEGKTKLKVDPGIVSSGIYFLRVESRDEVKEFKLVVQESHF